MRRYSLVRRLPSGAFRTPALVADRQVVRGMRMSATISFLCAGVLALWPMLAFTVGCDGNEENRDGTETPASTPASSLGGANPTDLPPTAPDARVAPDSPDVPLTPTPPLQTPSPDSPSETGPQPVIEPDPLPNGGDPVNPEPAEQPSGGGTAGAGGVSVGGSGVGGGEVSAGGGNTAPDSNCGSHKWACWPMPNPAGSGLPNEASYTNNADGTVTDDVTGLMWQGDAPSESFSWQEAIDYCEALSLAAHDDWRLPTRVEMTSVMDFSRSGAKFDGEAFPGAQGGFYKTASDWILTIEQAGAGAGNDFAWAFNMSDGIVSNAYSKATAARLRCVRGNGEGEAPGEPAVAPADLYGMVAEGEVQDNYTGLIWQAGYSDDYLSWEGAAAYCDGLTLNGHSWRLPSIRELATLVDEARVAPSIDEAMFPDTRYGSRSNDWYWASHRSANNDQAAWALNFDDGFTGFNAGTNGDWNYWTEAWAKCVR